MWKGTEAPGHPFPILAARDIIAPLKLIDGDTVWSDQRFSSLPPAVPNRVWAPLDLRQPCPPKCEGAGKCEQFSPRRLPLWRSPQSAHSALTTPSVRGSSTL